MVPISTKRAPLATGAGVADENPSNPWHPLALKGAEAAVRSLAVQLQIVEVRRPEELDNAFAAMTKERAGAVLVLSDP